MTNETAWVGGIINLPTGKETGKGQTGFETREQDTPPKIGAMVMGALGAPRNIDRPGGAGGKGQRGRGGQTPLY